MVTMSFLSFPLFLCCRIYSTRNMSFARVLWHQSVELEIRRSLIQIPPRSNMFSLPHVVLLYCQANAEKEFKSLVYRFTTGQFLNHAHFTFDIGVQA